MRSVILTRRFSPRGFARPWQSFASPLLEAPGQARNDGRLLLLAPRRMAVQAHFLRVGAQHPVQTDALPAGGGELDRLEWIKLTSPLARDHQVAIAVCSEPSEVVLGGNAPIHHHQRPGRGLRALEHAFERACLHRIARKHLGAFHETAGIEHQAQGEQRAFGALLLEWPRAALGLPFTAPSK